MLKKEIVWQYKHSKSMNVQRGEFVCLFDSSYYMTTFLKVSAPGIGVEKESKKQFWVWSNDSAECVTFARSSLISSIYSVFL